MSISLETIQEMWVKDSKINEDDLGFESLKIPQLHAKYFDLYNTLVLLKKSAEQKYKKIDLERYKYYTGKAEPEIYVEEPFPYKVREKEAIQKYMQGDEKLSNAKLKVEYYDVMIDYLDQIIKIISSRTFQIKNAIEWERFKSGA